VIKESLLSGGWINEKNAASMETGDEKNTL